MREVAATIIPYVRKRPQYRELQILERLTELLVRNGCRAVAEGANMPTEQAGIDILQRANVLFARSNAANAGGVTVSGLEMTQNSMPAVWTRPEMNQRLREIVVGIHSRCVEHGTENGRVDYVKGANIAGFVKLADAIQAYGVM